MLKSLKQLFDSLVPPPSHLASVDAEHRLQLATAVMLVEVMRADTTFTVQETEAVHAALREKFQLSADEATRLSELAVNTARGATDLFSFTSHIDELFSMAQKVRMIELMWAVAYADGHLADHERHVLWRVADLLHVPQGAYVLARQRASEAAHKRP
jgi:uncharacterized tellurite resistance protein B-like protein